MRQILQEINSLILLVCGILMWLDMDGDQLVHPMQPVEITFTISVLLMMAGILDRHHHLNNRE